MDETRLVLFNTFGENDVVINLNDIFNKLDFITTKLTNKFGDNMFDVEYKIFLESLKQNLEGLKELLNSVYGQE